MGVNWGEALDVGLKGFGTVFVVLIILAVAVFLVGLAIRRSTSKNSKVESTEKKADTESCK